MTGGDKVIINSVDNTVGHVILKKIHEFTYMIRMSVAEKPACDMYFLSCYVNRTQKIVKPVVVVYRVHVRRIDYEKASVGAFNYIAHSAVDKTVIRFELIENGICNFR